MAIDPRTAELIRQKALSGQKLSTPTADKQKAYDSYQNKYIGIINQKAAAGQKLSDPNAWKQSIYDKAVASKKPTTPTPTTPTATAFNQEEYLKNQQNNVNSIYDQQKNAQMAQFNAERDKAMGLINQQKAEVAPQYANKRNQADVVNAQNVNKLREMMAANGISASGENVTANVALGSARQGALSQLNLQEQQTNNDFNRQITDINNPERVNAMIAQLEAQRSEALYNASNRADDVGYSRLRDGVMDGRYADETQYNRGQDSKQWDYQIGRDKVADDRYGKEWDYQVGRDKVGDSQWKQGFDYQKTRDAVGDNRWGQEFSQDNQRYAQEKAWREYTYKNMSASDKAQMAQNASQFGEEMAWKMYSQEYQGELSKSLSQAELEVYQNGGNFSQGAGLGALSQKYESSGNPATIANNAGDIGGKSYGTYQLSTSSGNAQTFANKYGGAFKGLKVGTAAFDNAWKAEASRNPKAFASAQHNYIKATHYDPVLKANPWLSKYPRAVQDAVWSTSVQHGVGGAKNILNKVARVGMTPETIINAIYNERSRNNGMAYFPSSSSSIRNGVLNRFSKERNDALRMLKG